MKAVSHRAAFAIVFFCACTRFAAAESALRQSFDLQVLQPPTPVAVAGVTELVYELHLASFADVPLAHRRVAGVQCRGGILNVDDEVGSQASAY